MTRTTLILFLLVVAAHSIHAQTVADIEAKYGKSVVVYSVSEHIWMTPEYAADGQVCRMRLYSKRIDSTTNFGSTKLPFAELRDVLNDLVPLEMRGNKKEGFGLTDVGGGVAWTKYEYENVLFSFVSYFRLTSNPKGGLNLGEVVLLDSDLDAAPEPPKNLAPGKDDFATTESTENVTVIWNGRKCMKQ